MTWFQAFRSDFGYTYYGEHRTSVTVDIPFVAITYTCTLISVATIIAVSGIRGKERWYTLIRLIYSLAVGSIILGTFEADGSSFMYNEELELDQVFNSPQQLLSALERGLPQPLLFLIERFGTDEGGIRFGRFCWMAGYFAHILLWTALAFWITSNILLCSVIWYGAAMFCLTGVCMILAVVAYHVICAQTSVTLPYADGLLVLRYNWCFWAVLVFGILTTFIGLILFVLDKMVPKKLATFFLLDGIEDKHEACMPIRTDRQATLNTQKQGHVNYGFDNNPTHINPISTTEDIATCQERMDSQRQGLFSEVTDEEHQQPSSGKPSPNATRVQKHFYCPQDNSADQIRETITDIYVDAEPQACNDEQKQQIVGNCPIQELHTVINVQQL